ncbi:hypothetical protein HGH92_23980 [Chitinophaga varians]|uniref:Uncharacterized protein n=1 Tax=Chitinophaga varians TaxID=2202339 RepID=A0A847RZE1_9BACT|nr:hypothetical protein [Chitinophaga varians]NLR67384.1 hypothetical protein [Chitinophaga varians]
MKKICLTYGLLLAGSLLYHVNAQTYPGPVGIGTNPSPDFLLHVAGKSRFEGTAFFGEWYDPVVYGKGIQITRHTDQGDNQFHLSFIRSGTKIAGMGFLRNSNVFAIQNDADNSSQRGIFLDGVGRVGIGITNPDQQLLVAGNIGVAGLGNKIGVAMHDYMMYNNQNQPNYGMQWTLDSWSSNGPTYWLSGFGGMKFFTGGAPRLAVSYTGNVGIGVTSPNNPYKLAVDGTIGARRIKVTQETWADFVFDSAYVLPSLKEVAQHTQTKGHLPGIPSASEIAKQGLDLGDMQQRQMQKIEGLTLYLIDQQKKMETQQTKINTQEELIMRLQQQLKEQDNRLRALEAK